MKSFLSQKSCSTFDTMDAKRMFALKIFHGVYLQNAFVGFV
jgi:hypothetical protein